MILSFFASARSAFNFFEAEACDLIASRRETLLPFIALFLRRKVDVRRSSNVENDCKERDIEDSRRVVAEEGNTT